MKKYVFLIQCASHCGPLCGKLAVIMTDVLTDPLHRPTEDKSRFIPGQDIFFVPLTPGSSFGTILADLTLAGFTEEVLARRQVTKDSQPPHWYYPEQFVEVKSISVLR